MSEVLVYVGPPGGSDERGALGFSRPGIDPPLPLDSLERVIRTVDTTPGTLGCMAIEDSLHGEYSNAMASFIGLTSEAIFVDSFLLEEQIFVVSREPDTRPRAVVSHPLVLQSLSNEIRELGLEMIPAATTDMACAMVDAEPEGLAALAPMVVAEHRGLAQHNKLTRIVLEVRTRFGLIGHDVPSPTGSDQTLLLLWPTEDKAGTLDRILGWLAGFGIDLVRLESEYFGPGEPHGFIIEAKGHLHDEALSDALGALMSRNVRVRPIGVFPRADQVQLAFQPPPERSLNNPRLVGSA